LGKAARLQVVEVSGKPYDMGRQAGAKCKSKATAYRKAIAESVEFYTGKTWKHAVGQSKQYLPYARDFYPDFVEEIEGYSDGAGMPFQEAFSLCCHELLSPQGYKGCTDVVASDDVTADGRVLVGHNEDWDAQCLQMVVLLRAKPSKKPSFICTSYAGLVPSTGMNDKGICLTGNALSPNDSRVGIPKLFPVRKTLEARRIGEALAWAMPKERASSYNNICSDRNGEIYSLEGSATDCAWLYAYDGYMVHTNHYVAEKMQRFESDPDGVVCSKVRFNRATRLIESQLGEVTLESMMGIFRDHANRPDSICRHRDPKVHILESSETIFSVIFEPKRLRVYACKGHPCEGTYFEHRLGD
jgi:isopenicillin-N N-acyltransferase-like protein